MEPSWDEYERLQVVRRMRDMVQARFGLRIRFAARLPSLPMPPAVASASIVLLGRRVGHVYAEGEDGRLAPSDAKWLQEFVRACAEEAASFDEEAFGARSPDPEFGGDDDAGYCGIIGRSRAMRRLFGLLDRVAPADSTVLVQGDNGTGKELVARAIHARSSRKEAPFIVTNCSAFNDNLLDSELFGHRKGAFTGAVSDKAGLFDLADGGTFFLDEIGDTSPVLQVKLLRVLQEGTFLPVGGTQQHKVDVRVVAATNQDLAAMVREGTFRQDLYYRLHVINLHLPRLADRGGDVGMLIEHFLDEHGGRRTVGRKRLSPDAVALLEAHDWPGNVRELENEIERLVVMSGDLRIIDEDLVSPRIRQAVSQGRPGGAGLAEHADSLPGALQALERTMIRDALRRARWNKTRAAEDLGISRRNLIRKVRAYGLERREVR